MLDLSTISPYLSLFLLIYAGGKVDNLLKIRQNAQQLLISIIIKMMTKFLAIGFAEIIITAIDGKNAHFPPHSARLS
jgi:hypothetical protein